MVIEGEEVKRDDPVKYFLTLIKRFLEEGRMEGEKELVLLFVGEEQMGEAKTLRNEGEEESFREMLTST